MRTNKTKIKICGITTEEDIEILNENQIDYAGFVLFYPKSKRYIQIEKARQLKTRLLPTIKTVAVMVSPSLEHIKQIEESEFDYIQVHGIIEADLLAQISIPVLRAFSVDSKEKMEQKIKQQIRQDKKIAGYVLDGKIPGAGKPFDWAIAKEIERENRLFFLAGGLNTENVLYAMQMLHPDVVDVSSGVEYNNQKGKDPNKVKRFAEQVKTDNININIKGE